MEPSPRRVLWTELIGTLGRCSALYRNTVERILELNELCAQIEKAEHARGDQNTLNQVREIQRVVTEMAKPIESLKPLLDGLESAKPKDSSEALSDALDTAKKALSDLQTARDRLSSLREQLIGVRDGRPPS